mgnify:CR=1 FL=1
MKYVGLDLGSVTCGVSKSDTGLIAQAVKTIRFERDNYDDALDKIEEYVDEYKPDLIVMGYPLLENGDAGPKAQLCAEFARIMEEETGIPCKLQDERNTTKDSHEFLINNFDMSRKKRKKIIDQQHAVAGREVFLAYNNVVGVAMGERHNLAGVDIIGNVFGFALLGKHHGHLKNIACHNGNGNAGGLYGHDLGHVFIAEQAVQLYTHFIHQLGVHLMIQKIINFQDPTGENAAIIADTVFQKLHDHSLL